MSDNVFETGVVAQTDGDVAVIQLAEQENCKACGARILCKADNSGQRTLRAKNTINAKIGQQVQISEQANILLKISFLQYGIPFIGFMTGIVLAYVSQISLLNLPPELLWFSFGLLGLVSGGVISWIGAKKLANNNTSAFEIIK